MSIWSKHNIDRIYYYHRLSEIASARLRTNNPDIADLSDSNRVTKLAERLSELYDNEWTDGFEQIKAASTKTEQLTDKHVSEALKDMLKVYGSQPKDILILINNGLHKL